MAAAGTGGGSMFFGAVQQCILDNLGLQWTLCIVALVLCTGIICGLFLSPGPTKQKMDQFQTDQSSEDVMQGLVLSSEQTNSTDPCQTGSKTTKDKQSCMSAFQDIFDFSLFKNLSQILFCVGLIMVATGYYIPDIYLPEYAMSSGVTAQNSANLISIIGFANLVSRLLFGFIGDYGPRLRLSMCGCFMAILGLISILLPFFPTYTIFIIYAILFGICVGCYVSLYSVILVDMFGLPMLPKSLGLALFAVSPLYLFGSPLIGLLIDTLGYVSVSFYIPGSICVVGSMIFSSNLCVHDFSNQDYRRIP